MSFIQAKMQMEGGGGIILWADFWKIVSRLMDGESVEQVLSSERPQPTSSQQQQSSSSGSSSSTATATTTNHVPLERSDSDIARALQAQFDAGNFDANIPQEDSSKMIEEEPIPPRTEMHRSICLCV